MQYYAGLKYKINKEKLYHFICKYSWLDFRDKIPEYITFYTTVSYPITSPADFSKECVLYNPGEWYIPLECLEIPRSKKLERILNIYSCEEI
jgi:methyltransferase-like protein